MGSFSFGLATAALAFSLYGCTSQVTAQPAKPPPRAAEPRTEALPETDEAPRLIAPPPAYGHKVVMAKGARRVAAQ